MIASSPASPWCQRWRDRRHSWRHTSEGGFDPRRYEVAELAEASARPFVIANHYAGTYPAARFAFGLFDGAWLVGVAVLSNPAQSKVLTKVFPDLVPYEESLELGRFVLGDQVPAPAETWFLARVWKLARRRGLRGIVSFSDPIARTALDGRVIFPGHVGLIHQAANAIACGRGTARKHVLGPNGEILSPRAEQKIRKGEQGYAYAEAQLVAAGAARRRGDEEPRVWLKQAKAALRRLDHPGCWRYAFPLDRRVRIGLERTPYPCPCHACRAREQAVCS